MKKKELLSVSDISRELNTGKATIKFLLKRFQEWLPCEYIDGQAFYPQKQTIKRLFLIQGNLDMGLLPSDIEKKLSTKEHTKKNQDSDKTFDPAADHLTRKDVRLSRDGIDLIHSLFQKICDQQKRIAIAHEKRAETEEKKAAAMNNIAKALQKMNTLRSTDTAARQTVPEAAAVMAADENSQEDTLPHVILDDLSLLIDPVSDKNPEQDDLSKLIEDSQTDDLSLLIEDSQTDDLSLLIEEDKAPDIKTSSLPQMDDLSKLIDEPEASKDPADVNNKPEDVPVIKIDISPQEDLSRYKAAVTKVIVGLKAEGVTVEDAAIRLNNNHIKTLSGKPEWSIKAISQIYKFIESAK